MMAATERTASEQPATPLWRRSPGAGSPRRRELGPATRANWNFVLGHLQPVLGEHKPMSFLALSGAVLSLLKTVLGAGTELFGFRSRRGHLGCCSCLAPLKSKARRSPNVPAREWPAGVFRVCCPAVRTCAQTGGFSLLHDERCGRRINDPRRTRDCDRHPMRHGAGYRVLRRGNALSRRSITGTSLRKRWTCWLEAGSKYPFTTFRDAFLLSRSGRMRPSRFPTGKMVLSRNATAVMKSHDVAASLRRVGPAIAAEFNRS